jgi:hypothetical protein
MPFDLDDLPPLRELILGGPVPFLVAFSIVALLGRRRPILGAALALVAGYLVLSPRAAIRACPRCASSSGCS